MRIGTHTIDFPGDWRLELTAATQRLLGDAIALSDEDWQSETILPGWSRAHVATHLSRHAESLAEMALTIARTKQSIRWRPRHTDADLNAGSYLGAIALQEALDQSSAQLMEAFDQMDDQAWATRVQTTQGLLPASVFVLDRLNEVVVHHVDLNLGFDFSDVDTPLVRTLLQWNLFRASPRFSHVNLQIISDEDFTAAVGCGTRMVVRGQETNLLGWLTGRKDPTTVLGAEDLDLAGPV